MSIEFKRAGIERDGVTPYEVDLDNKEYTVIEFVEEILRERTYDKGSFSIMDQNRIIVSTTEYAYGHTHYSFRIPIQYRTLKVKSVTSDVQWSRIDYYIETGDADERES